MCSRWSKEGSDVDAHVEDTECQISFSTVFGIVVQIPDQCLQVSFEAACSNCDQCQRTEHHHFGAYSGSSRDGQQQIADKHDDDTYLNRISIAQFIVCEESADNRQKIDCCQENTKNGTGRIGAEAEFGLHEQYKNGQHGIVTEAFSHIGQ